MNTEEELEVRLGGIEYKVDGETFKAIQAVIGDAHAARVDASGVDTGVVEMLRELTIVDWAKLIPDKHTRALLALGIFVDYYDWFEAAGELVRDEYTPEYFMETRLDIGSNAGRVLGAIEDGDF